MPSLSPYECLIVMAPAQHRACSRAFLGFVQLISVHAVVSSISVSEVAHRQHSIMQLPNSQQKDLSSQSQQETRRRMHAMCHLLGSHLP